LILLNRLYKTIALFFFVSITFGDRLFAQENLGEIQDEEVIIRKGKKIKLPPANRNYKKIRIDKPSGFKNELDLEFRTANVGLSPLDPAIRVKTIKSDPLEKLYAAYVKGSLGNYGTTNLEVYWENKRSKKTGIGFFADHLASSRGPGEIPELSGESHNKIGLFGEFSRPNSFGFGKIGYQADHFNYYGFDQTAGTGIIIPTEEDLKHNFGRFYTILGLKSFDPASYWVYDFKFDYQFTRDNFKFSENWIQTKLDINYELDPGFKIGGELGFYSSIYGSDTSKYSRTVFEFSPYISQKKEKYAFQAGIRLASENDTMLSGDIHFYPFGIFTYHVIPQSIDIYLGLDGRPEIFSFHAASLENPWIGQNIYLGTSNLVLDIFGGAKGKLGNQLWYDLNLHYKTIDRLPMFINDFSDTSRFDLLFENGNSTLLQLQGLFTWQIVKTLSLDFGAKLNNYSMSKQNRPWHLPATELDLKANYLFREKIMFKAGFLFMNGIYAFNSQGSEIQLDLISDLSLGLDYFVSKRFTLFADFNNLVGKNYQRYLNYPVKGFNFIAGASYSF